MGLCEKQVEHRARKTDSARSEMRYRQGRSDSKREGVLDRQAEGTQPCYPCLSGACLLVSFQTRGASLETDTNNVR